MRQAVLLLVMLLGVTPVLAADLPQRKSGLWELKVQSFRREEERTMQLCVDQKTDNAFRQLIELRRHEDCKKVTLRREGDKQLVDAECKLAGGENYTKTHAVITGSFDSKYVIETTSTFTRPIHDKSEGAAKIEARWTGPCQADQKPGDVIAANGTKYNLDDVESASSKRLKRQAAGEKAKKQIQPQ
ncbi:MAG TPA: DUF3617 family protein [Casimicrobiaceae bacterium]|jgi:hypothetical protein|nr:DUF3617 family protein [Casimicrobiaceae bacterium]